MTAMGAGKPLGFPARLRRAIARFGSADGSAAAEFAILSPFLVAILLACVEVGYVSFAKSELNRIAGDAARAVELDQTQSMTQAEFNATVCADIAVIIQCNQLYVSVVAQASCSAVSTAPPNLTYDGNGNLTSVPTYNPGTFGSILVLQALYPLPIFGAQLLNWSNQANGTMLIYATIVFVNEP